MKYMTTKEAAEQWGYTPGTVAKWCREDKMKLVLRPEKIGREWRIPKDTVCPRPIKKK